MAARRKSGKFRKQREKVRQSRAKTALQEKKEAARELAAASRKKVTGDKAVATPRGVFKVSAKGHLRGKVRPSKLKKLSLEKAASGEDPLAEDTKSLGVHLYKRRKKMSASTSEDDAALMAALRSVVVDSETVMQGAVDSAKRKRKIRGASKSTTKSKRRLGDSSDEDPELAHYQIRTQDMLHRHLDETFGSLLEYDSLEDGENTKSLPGGSREQPEEVTAPDNGLTVKKKRKKQRSLESADVLKVSGKVAANGDADKEEPSVGGIRLFSFGPKLSRPQLKEDSAVHISQPPREEAGEPSLRGKKREKREGEKDKDENGKRSKLSHQQQEQRNGKVEQQKSSEERELPGKREKETEGERVLKGSEGNGGDAAESRGRHAGTGKEVGGLEKKRKEMKRKREREEEGALQKENVINKSTNEGDVHVDNREGGESGAGKRKKKKKEALDTEKEDGDEKRGRAEPKTVSVSEARVQGMEDDGNVGRDELKDAKKVRKKKQKQNKEEEAKEMGVASERKLAADEVGNEVVPGQKKRKQIDPIGEGDIGSAANQKGERKTEGGAGKGRKGTRQK